jgi:Uma2 family endonuclease
MPGIQNDDKLVTAEDLAALDDDPPFELIRGKLRAVEFKFGLDGMTAGSFVAEFGMYGREALSGTVFTSGVGFFAEHNPDTVVALDVAFIRADRLPAKKELEQDYLRVPPDAIVEVLCPTNCREQVEEKVCIFLETGVRLVLVADPRRRTIALRTRRA